MTDHADYVKAMEYFYINDHRTHQRHNRMRYMRPKMTKTKEKCYMGENNLIISTKL